MIRFIAIFVSISALAAGLAWIANNTGTVNLPLGSMQADPSAFMLISYGLIIFLVLWLVVKIFAKFLTSPRYMFNYFRVRRNLKGKKALTKGIIAVGAGDVAMAHKYAQQADRILGNEEPLTQLLKAQAAQLRNDMKTVHEVFETMSEIPDTEILGLRGLFTQAKEEGNFEKARYYAERALKLRPALVWASEAVLISSSMNKEWANVNKLISDRKDNMLITDSEADKQRAVILIAEALESEEKDQDFAMEKAIQAHKLDNSLIPAAVLAGKILGQKGKLRKASKILETTWKVASHPDIADTYANLIDNASPKDKLKTIRNLLKHGSSSLEEQVVALAKAAIEAKEWGKARKTLEYFINKGDLTARICTLMAETEAGEFGDKGKVRQWLAKALNASKSPVWTADGYVTNEWQPISPVTGKIGVFEWKVALESLDGSVNTNILASDELLLLDTIDPVGNDKLVDTNILASEDVKDTELVEDIGDTTKVSNEAEIVNKQDASTNEEYDINNSEVVDIIVSTDNNTNEIVDNSSQDKYKSEDIIVVKSAGSNEKTNLIRQPDDPGTTEPKKSRRSWYNM